MTEGPQEPPGRTKGTQPPRTGPRGLVSGDGRTCVYTCVCVCGVDREVCVCSVSIYVCSASREVFVCVWTGGCVCGCVCSVSVM